MYKSVYQNGRVYLKTKKGNLIELTLAMEIIEEMKQK